MKVLVIGGGAREHAIVWTLAQDPAVREVICAPGNPGIETIARCVPVDVQAIGALAELAQREQVDLTVVGPELPLSLGVVDTFVARGLPIVGPTRAAASLESSKAFAKAFMARHQVPTARFTTCASSAEARAVLDAGGYGYPVVLKADGLAAGKGVVVAADRGEADAAIRAMMDDRQFGAAGDQLVVEEFLAGTEASYFVLASGTEFVTLASAQDHKRIFDDDRGPNTGGMGAFAPSPLLTPTVEDEVIARIVQPVLAGMAAEGHPYSGFLYVGLMLTADGPKVVEFNVRLGDPETQVILPMLDEPLAPLLLSAAHGTVARRAAKFRSAPHVVVVLATAGYPGTVRTGDAISGLAAAAAVPGALVFHAGTARRDDAIVTAGGRVLAIVGRGATYQEAIATAYRAAALVHFDGMQLRSDIGRKAIAVG